MTRWTQTRRNQVLVLHMTQLLFAVLTVAAKIFAVAAVLMVLVIWVRAEQD